MFSVLLAVLSLAGTPSVMSLDGKWHKPIVEAKGRTSVILFISHDCPICNSYAPEIKRIAKKYRADGVRFSLVYAEPDLSEKDARAHAKAYAYSGFSMYMDSHAELSKYVGATITPEAAVYDETGTLRYLGRIDNLYVAYGKQRNRATTHDLRTALDSVLAHRKVANPTSTPVGCFIATN
jgi:thiol-disulfide isomerase/thioredoxin